MAQITGIQPKSSPRVRWSWYLYDFGNSAYAAVVLLAVFSAYFKQQVVGGARGSWLWGLSLGIAMLVVAIISPILGTIADYSGTKKRNLFFFTVMSCFFTAMLFFVQAGDIALGMVFFILAEIGYRSAQVFYNALLPDIASEEEMGHVSGNGWAVGSAGGIVCLLIVLPLIVFIGGTFVVRLSLAITALFFLLSTIPLFLWVKETKIKSPIPEGRNIFAFAFGRLWKTFREARNYKEFIKFLISFLIFNDGILMTLDFAAILGAVLFGMNQQQLIIFMIIVQVTSVIGAYLSGKFADRYGTKTSLVISLALMIITILILIFLVDDLYGFFGVGALAGFALTGVQSVSRTMVAQMSPEEKSAEFYGLFAVAGRTSSSIGPTLFGLLAAQGALWYERQGMAVIEAEKAGQRVGLFSIVAFLAVGLIFLLFVRDVSYEKRQKQPK